MYRYELRAYNAGGTYSIVRAYRQFPESLDVQRDVAIYLAACGDDATKNEGGGKWKVLVGEAWCVHFVPKELRRAFRRWVKLKQSLWI